MTEDKGSGYYVSLLLLMFIEKLWAALEMQKER